MKSRIPQLLAVALLVALVGALPAFADTPVTGVIYASASNSSLYTVNPTNGAATFVGTFTGGLLMTDIGFLGTQLYAVGPLAAANTNLYTVNSSTAATALVGGNGVFLNALGAAGGVLYAAGGDPINGGGVFGTVNTATGAFTNIHTNPTNSSGDLALATLNGTVYGTIFAAGGKNTGSDRLVSVDLLTGVETIIGDIGKANVFGLASLGGVLYGLDGAGELLSINTGTGAGTLVGTAAGLSWTGATALDTPTRTPEPASLLLLGGGLLALAGALRRRI